MKLTYIYHSCFVLEFKAFIIIIDYFEDTQKISEKGLVHTEILNSPKKIYVLSSHSHPDHFNPEILTWNLKRDNIQYILSKDILEAKLAQKEDAVFLDKKELHKDNNLSIKAFGSTDIGISFFIEAEDYKIFHAGDLNNWHWNEECSPEESKEYEANYLLELEELAQEVKHLELAIFPVDPRLGKDYMRGAEQFVSKISTDYFSPMHFDNAYDKAAAFQYYAKSKGCKVIKWGNKGECIEL